VTEALPTDPEPEQSMPIIDSLTPNDPPTAAVPNDAQANDLQHFEPGELEAK